MRAQFQLHSCTLLSSCRIARRWPSSFSLNMYCSRQEPRSLPQCSTSRNFWQKDFWTFRQAHLNHSSTSRLKIQNLHRCRVEKLTDETRGLPRDCPNSWYRISEDQSPRLLSSYTRQSQLGLQLRQSLRVCQHPRFRVLCIVSFRLYCSLHCPRKWWIVWRRKPWSGCPLLCWLCRQCKSSTFPDRRVGKNWSSACRCRTRLNGDYSSGSSSKIRFLPFRVNY